MDVSLLFLPPFPLSKNPLLDLHPEELKAGSRRHTRICPPMFKAALFRIARRWKQPKCPSADEWTNTMWCMQAMKYHAS